MLYLLYQTIEARVLHRFSAGNKREEIDRGYNGYQFESAMTGFKCGGIRQDEHETDDAIIEEGTISPKTDSEPFIDMAKRGKNKMHF